jgi:tetratricopeptide (TPR) repeat protein
MRRGRKGIALLLGTVLFGMLLLTGWNLTRSTSLDEARRAYSRGTLVLALGGSLDHLSRQPWSRDASLIAALCLSRLDFASAAEPYYQSAGTLSLGDLQIRAYGLVRGNHREQAIQAYREILKRWPENVLAMRRLAAVQMTQSNDSEVLKLADRLVQIPDGAAIGYTLLGIVHHNQKNHEDAVAALERVLVLDPELRVMPLPRRLFWSHLVSELTAVGRPADSRRYLLQALKDNPDAYLMTSLGLAYEFEGSTEDAERCYRHAMEWDARYSPPYLYLGKIELHRRHTEEALRHLHRALELAPKDYDVVYNLALAYRQIGRTEEASRFQSKAIELRPKPASTPAPPKAPPPRYAL